MRSQPRRGLTLVGAMKHQGLLPHGRSNTQQPHFRGDYVGAVGRPERSRAQETTRGVDMRAQMNRGGEANGDTALAHCQDPKAWCSSKHPHRA